MGGFTEEGKRMGSHKGKGIIGPWEEIPQRNILSMSGCPGWNHMGLIYLFEVSCVPNDNLHLHLLKTHWETVLSGYT